MILTTSGDVYTWSHQSCEPSPSTSDIPPIPTYIPCLRGKGIVNIACGGSLSQGDAFYLACNESGVVYSWGDGAHGKLGRGDSGTTKSPMVVDKLQVSVLYSLEALHFTLLTSFSFLAGHGCCPCLLWWPVLCGLVQEWRCVLVGERRFI